MSAWSGLVRGALALALCAAACGGDASPELTLAIRVPANDQELFEGVTKLNLIATRDEIVLAQGSFAASAGSVSLSGVTHGPRTIIALEGVDAFDQVIAHGQTCPLDFETGSTVAPLYFAPTNFFSPTIQPPEIVRYDAVGAALDDGTVLVLGGAAQAEDGGPGETALATGEIFVPGAATFAPLSATLSYARRGARSAFLPDVGLLVVGGAGDDGVPQAKAELYLESQSRFVPLVDPRLDGRVDHSVVLLPDGRALITGGASSAGVGLASTLLLSVRRDGTYQTTAGPTLVEARRAHAATVAVGVPIVFGGYGADGVPIASIEAIDIGAATSGVIASLRVPRAEATASVLSDGSILLVGGIGLAGAPLADAELFNPITRSTASYPLAYARRGHSATVLPDGRVMIAGGVDAAGAPIAEVELFVPGVGFLSERPLGTPRGGHLAVPLCDETVLLIGGGAGAEIYTGAPGT
jgi:hypothetical protein